MRALAPVHRDSSPVAIPDATTVGGDEKQTGENINDLRPTICPPTSMFHNLTAKLFIFS